VLRHNSSTLHHHLFIIISSSSSLHHHLFIIISSSSSLHHHPYMEMMDEVYQWELKI